MSNTEDTILDSTPFTQCDYWQIFQHELGKTTRVLEGNDWRCLLVEQTTKLGRYWIAFHGPVVKNQLSLEYALKSIVTEAKKENISWIVIEPWGKNINVAKSCDKILRAYKDYNPANTSVLDLTKSEAELRSALSPTYRNLINRSKSRGISLKVSVDPNEINLFLDMLHHVEAGNKIRLHDDHYFRIQANTLMPLGTMRLEIAYYKDTPVATAIILESGNVASYVYAASMREYRKLEPGTVLLWSAIMDTKKRGNKLFDLFGVAPLDAPASHPWAGFSTFKRKFGGVDFALSGTWEIPIDKKRYLTYRASLPLARQLQKLKR